MTVTASLVDLAKFIAANRSSRRGETVDFLNCLASEAERLAGAWQQVCSEVVEEGEHRLRSTEALSQRLDSLMVGRWILRNPIYHSHLMTLYRAMNDGTIGRMEADFRESTIFHIGKMLFDREQCRSELEAAVAALGSRMASQAERRDSIAKLSRSVEQLLQEAGKLRALADSYRLSEH
jgi:hypothetical protein